MASGNDGDVEMEDLTEKQNPTKETGVPNNFGKPSEFRPQEFNQTYTSGQSEPGQTQQGPNRTIENDKSPLASLIQRVSLIGKGKDHEDTPQPNQEQFKDSASASFLAEKEKMIDNIGSTSIASNNGEKWTPNILDSSTSVKSDKWNAPSSAGHADQKDYTAEGAIPKTQPDQRPEKPWKDFFVIVGQSNGTTFDLLENCNAKDCELSPVKMQYCIQYHFTELLEIFKADLGKMMHNMKQVLPSHQCIQFDVRSVPTQTYIEEIIVCLQDTANKVNYFQRFPASKVFVADPETLLKEYISLGQLAVYREQEATYVVGMVEDSKKVTEKLKKVPQDESITYDTKTVDLKMGTAQELLVLKVLGFKDHLDKVQPNVRLVMNEEKDLVSFHGKTSDVDSAVDEVDKFMKSLLQKDIPLEPMFLKLIKLPRVRERLKELFRMQNLKVFWHVSAFNNRVTCYVLNEHERQLFHDMLRQNFVMINYPIGRLSSKENDFSGSQFFNSFVENHLDIDLVSEVRDTNHCIVTVKDLGNELALMEAQFKRNDTMKTADVNTVADSKELTFEQKREKTFVETFDEDVYIIKPEKYWELEKMKLLKKFNFSTDISTKIPSIKIQITDEEIKFVGVEMKAVKDEISLFMSRLNSLSIDKIPQVVLQFLKTSAVAVENIESGLKSKGILCHWYVSEACDCLNIISLDSQAVKNAEDQILETVKILEYSSTDDMKEILNCQEIKVLMKKRKGQLQIDDLQCDDFLVFGLKESVEEFSLTYEKIMDKYKPSQTKQKVKDTKKVKLGARKDVLEFFTKHKYDKWREFLDDYQTESEVDGDDEVWLIGEERQIHAAISEFRRKIKLNRRKWSCEVHYPMEVLKQIDANTIQLIENESKTSISIQNDTNLVQQQQLGQWVEGQFKIHLVLVHGNLYEMAADVLVCPTNEKFEPSSLAKVMLDKGGSIMKDDFSDTKKRKAVGKNIYVTSNTGNLPCTMVAYLVVPEYQHGMNMQNDVVKCIQELFSSVENAQLQSIVIPVKILDHIPETTFLHWFVSAFNGFHHQLNHLKHIYLCTQYSIKTEGLFEVLKTSLPKALECYDFDHMCDHLETQNIRSLKPPKITIKLVKGVLVDQNVDVIVNSCNRELELKKGAVSSTILKKGGQSILAECGKRWPHGINFGEAIATTAGNMNFKFICHGALPHWTPGAKLSSQLLAKLVFDCMIYADSQKCRSIAFPVFGTGNLEYPWDVVAKIMIDTINKYGRMNSTKTEIREVRVVLYDQDAKSIEAFENRKKQTEEIKLVVEDPEPPPKYILEARCRSVRVQVIPLSDNRCHHCEAVVDFLNYGQALQIQKDNRESKLVTAGILTEKCADNNFWTVTVYSDEQPKTYKEAVSKALLFAADERIATLAFCLMLGKDTLKLKDQATLIRDLVNGLQKNRYLQAVKIVVPEREKFEKMLHKTIIKQEEESKTFFSKVSRVGEYVFNSNKLQWKCVSYSEIIESPRLIISALAENEISMKNLKVKLEGVIEKVVRQGGQLMGMTIKQDVGKRKHQQWMRTHKTDKGHIKKICLSEMVCKQLDDALKDKLPSTEVADGEDVFLYHLDKYEYSVIGKDDIRGIFFKGDYSSDPQQKGNEKDEVKKEKVVNRQVSDGIIDEILGDVSSKLLEKYKLQDIVKKVQHKFLDVEPLPVTSGVLTFKFKSLDLLEDVNKFLQITYKVTDSCIEKSNKQKTKEPPKRPPSIGSNATQHEVKVDMEREQFDKLMFFCRDTLKSAIYRDKQLFIKVSSKSECRKYEDLIRDEVDKINQLSQVDIKFEDDKKKTDIEKFIKEEFSSIFWKIDGKVIQLFGSNYQILQQAKHQVEIVSGSKQETKGRRNRKFADPVDSYTSQSNNDLDTSRKDTSRNTTNIPSESLSRSYGSLGGASISMAQTYTTSEGIIVKVYVGNILKLDVECIVNAANESLSHGGGVAAVISTAAGYQFDQESDDYVRLHGTIPVGSCCSTSAGNLHYKKVIHTVGPRWASYKYDEKNQCAKDLRKSIVCCFEEAEIFKLKSIALPSISAGIFGVPKEVCVAEYKNAVAEFSGNRKNGTCLREIHFIDKDFGLISLIQQEFTKTFQQSSQSSSSTLPGEKQDFRRSMSSVSNDGKLQQGSGSRSTRFAQSVGSKTGVFVVRQKIKVIVKTGDITKCEADAIVCPQEELLLSKGHIAREVEKICGHDYTVELKKLSIKKYGAKRMNAPRKCVWKYVIQAVPPRFTYEAEKNPQMFENNLKETILNILIATNYSRIKNLAIPLMGIADTGKTPVQKFADQFAIAVLKQVEDKDFTVEEIQVIVHDMKVVQKITGILETKELDGIKKVVKSGHRSHPGSLEEAMDVGDGGTGDVNGECCICMDKLDNPKTLACGHVFCTDCIEQQFKYKPSCPQCGQIHGVVTGTQPDGRMKITSKKYSLPGYSGTNTIEIEYMIYSGTQGKEHPNPGRYFEGITRTAFLPETKKGKMVLKLLDIAFKRKLVFTIGTSTTTGKTGVVTWNDIHHKTNPKPNTQFGYPDDTYLDRVLEELAAKGITEKDLQD